MLFRKTARVRYYDLMQGAFSGSIRHHGPVLFALAVSSLAAGCAPVYVAPAAHVPLFSGAGQVHLGGHWGTSGMDGQLAVAVDNELAIIAGGSFDPDTKGSEDDESHTYGEIGLAWFAPKSAGRKMEILGGLGYGRSSGEAQYTLIGQEITNTARGSYMRPFVQLNLGLEGHHTEVALASRFAYVRYQYQEIDLMPASDVRGVLFAEPMVVGRVGGRVKLEFQLGVSLPLNGSEEEIDVEHELFHLSVGLHVVLGGEDQPETL